MRRPPPGGLLLCGCWILAGASGLLAKIHLSDHGFRMSSASERIAIISDVHGNLTALEAVLDDIAARGIGRIFNLGDLVGKGPRSAEVVDRCRQTCEVVVQGNWDADVSSDTRQRPAPRWHHQQLGPERNAYLANLPGSHDCIIGGWPARFFHASQISPFQRVYENAPREVHRDMFSNTDFTGQGSQPKLVGYGDIHRPYVLDLDGQTLFNVGSVGNPLDQPLACYCVIDAGSGEDQPSTWLLNFVRVAYDIEAELAFAKASDMPDFEHYATELRTAVYRGLSAYSV